MLQSPLVKNEQETFHDFNVILLVEQETFHDFNVIFGDDPPVFGALEYPPSARVQWTGDREATTRRAAPEKGTDACWGDARGCAAPERRVRPRGGSPAP